VPRRAACSQRSPSLAERGAAVVGSPEESWVDGRSASDVSVLERGLHYGDGLFETLAVVGGVPRLLARHLKRLATGCERLGLGADVGAVEAEVRRVARVHVRAVIKVIVTRGAAVARGYALHGMEIPTRITLRYPWPREDATVRSGARVRMAALRYGENPQLAGLKHLNRLEQVLARREWDDPGIMDALVFSSSGDLVSGTHSNVFMVRDGTLLTPRLDRCGVAGVLRAQVLESAAACGIQAHERVLGAADLAAAQELFLTNALIGIRPVQELAGAPMQLGPVTRALQAHIAREVPGFADD
jgi:4-amino-4-deoxychorismate lyase